MTELYTIAHAAGWDAGYRAMKAAGSPSEAFDSGRYNGLKQALEILDRYATEC